MLFTLFLEGLIFGGLIFGGKFELVIRGVIFGVGIYLGFYGISGLVTSISASGVLAFVLVRRTGHLGHLGRSRTNPWSPIRQFGRRRTKLFFFNLVVVLTLITMATFFAQEQLQAMLAMVQQ